MPIFNLTPDNTVHNVIQDFKHETGLKLVILDGKTPDKGSMTIYDLFRKKHKFRACGSAWGKSRTVSMTVSLK